MQFYSLAGTTHIILPFGPCQLALAGQLLAISRESVVLELDTRPLAPELSPVEAGRLFREWRQVRLQMETTTLAREEVFIVKGMVEACEERGQKLELMVRLHEPDEAYLQFVREVTGEPKPSPSGEARRPLTKRFL